MPTVDEILDQIQLRGVEAALEYTKRFDGIMLTTEEIVFDPTTATAPKLPPEEVSALSFARDNICRFHEATRPQDITITPQPGITLGERYVPLGRVGIYVPNGGYPLVSSLLMQVIPAQVAGVKDIVVAIAPKDGLALDSRWLFALQMLGVRQVLRLGGAQAVASMAYGLKGFPPVDMITGPGNRFVTEAKQEVFRRGLCGIDLIAGPSEVLVIISDPSLAENAAYDLLAQAEHADDAKGIMVTWRPEVKSAVETIVAQETRRYEKPLGQIELHLVDSPIQAVSLANRVAPEHLGLMGDEAEALENQIRTAGALFVGPYSGQALGDYTAGPSHVLPTGGSGRFLSGLTTRTFMRRMSVIHTTDDLPENYLVHTQKLAHLEGLHYHEKSMRVRHYAREDNPS